MKILTISIAAYNVGDYLDKALSSLIGSDVIDDLEIVIVNDGSTDGTCDVAYKYVDKYPKSIQVIDKENGGYGSTINAALQVATGKYFKLLDGDDWFDADNLRKFIDILSTANADIVFTDYTEFYEHNGTTKLCAQPYRQDELFEFSDVQTICMHAMAVRTGIIRDMRITEKCFYTDLEYVLKCYLNAENAIYYPINVYCYRLGREGQSVSLSGLLKHIDEHKYIVDLAFDLYNSNEKFAHLKQRIYGHIATHISALLGAEPNKENYRLFLEYRDYALDKFDGIENMISNKGVALAFKHPRLFYRPMSFLKRMKYKNK